MQVSNLASAPVGQLLFHLTLDNNVLGDVQDRYILLPAGGYSTVVLDKLLTGLAPGQHTIRVQMENPSAGTSVRIDSVSTLSAEQFEAIPNVGPGVTFFTAGAPSGAAPLPGDGSFHDVGPVLT